MRNTITFFKIPVSVEDSNETFHLFDILLTDKFDENLLLMILSFLSKIRTIFCNQKNIDQLLSTFLDSQSFICFNFSIPSWVTLVSFRFNASRWCKPESGRIILSESGFFSNLNFSRLVIRGKKSSSFSVNPLLETFNQITFFAMLRRLDFIELIAMPNPDGIVISNMTGWWSITRTLTPLFRRLSINAVLKTVGISGLTLLFSRLVDSLLFEVPVNPKKSAAFV